MPAKVNHGDRPTMDTTPSAPVKVKDRQEIKRGQRGGKWVWLDSGGTLQRVVSASGMTGALASGIAAVNSISHPPDATMVICMITINANTNTAGQVRGMIFRDENGTTGQDAALHLSQEMGNNSWRSRIVGPVPFTRGGIFWMTEVNGTVNYDFFVDIVGWVLE